MNRVIKFRAWNKEKKIMCYSREDNEQSFWDGVNCTDVEMVNARLNSDFSEYEYMEYVGFPDKNKRDIYEGDIIDGLVVTYAGDTGACLGMSCGWYLQRDDFESWTELKCSDKYEVQGNIYENPELIQNKLHNK